MTVLFESTKLSTKQGKTGILTPDSEGYFTMVVGALNALNASNQFYTANGAKELFTSSSVFARRLKNGVVFAEVEHPKREKGMTDDDYMDRLLHIDRKNACAHIKDVWLDENYGRNNPSVGNPNMIAIMAKVKPWGPHAAILADAIKTGSINVCFSIRAFAESHFSGGRSVRVLETIVTFDCVLEGGIAVASKWDTPTLETITEKAVTQKMLQRFLDKTINSPVALEDSKALALEAMQSCFRSKVEEKAPAIYAW